MSAQAEIIRALAQRTHGDLIRARDRLPSDSLGHRVLAPAEHEAFAREWAEESPLLASLALVPGIPVYQGAKLLGIRGKDTTPASFDQLKGSYRGLLEGLGGR
jgi:hypothetical protein